MKIGGIENKDIILHVDHHCSELAITMCGTEYHYERKMRQVVVGVHSIVVKVEQGPGSSDRGTSLVVVQGLPK